MPLRSDAAIPFEPFLRNHMVETVRNFTQLFVELDEAREDRARLAALRRYFERAAPADAAWGLRFLLGRRVKPSVSAEQLSAWAGAISGHPDWLKKECARRVGDAIETTTLLLPTVDAGTAKSLAEMITGQVQGLADWDAPVQCECLKALWPSLDRDQAYIVHKMLTGSFRFSVSKALLLQALAAWSGVERIHLEHRLMETWQPTARFFETLVSAEADDKAGYMPYPFALPTPLDNAATLEGRWAAEWWWEGCRAQLIKRGGELFLWSLAGACLSEQFPEIGKAAVYLKNGTVLDGQVMVWPKNQPYPEGPIELETRLRREHPTASMTKKSPTVFVACDALESDGADLRNEPWSERRQRLEAVFQTLPEGGALRLSPMVGQGTLEALRRFKEGARDRGALGLVLKNPAARYVEGSAEKDCFLWRAEPLTARLTMIYAEAEFAGRGNRFSHYTLAASNGKTWVTLTKVERSRDAEEAMALDRWIQSHSEARRGPVRMVPAGQVFEIAFDGVCRAPRLKSGFSLRNPRMLRWIPGDSKDEVGTLSEFEAFIPDAGQT